MRAEAIREACEQFRRAREGGRSVAGLPESCRPQTAEDAEQDLGQATDDAEHAGCEREIKIAEAQMRAAGG